MNKAKPPNQIETAGFNLAQSANYVGLSKPTLKRLLDAGEMPFRRVGRRIIISRHVLDSWLNKQ